MLENTKARLRRTREFADKHQLVISHAAVAAAASATAVVLTRRADAQIAGRMLYNVGRENGVLTLQNIVLMKFIDSKALQDEFIEFIPDLMS